MTKRYTIMFADVARSMALFSALGDYQAQKHIVGLQKIISNAVPMHNGIVQDVIGDEVMSHFVSVDDALLCATKLHEYAMGYSASTGTDIKLRIGLHTGTVLMDESRIYGDTINVASRIAAVAIGQQTLVSAAVHAASSETLQSAMHWVDEAVLKGIDTPINVYELPWRADDYTAISANVPAMSETVVEFQYNNIEFQLDANVSEISVGRGESNSVLVDADPASRQHLLLTLARGKCVVFDRSTNGTHVVIGDQSPVFLRREQMPIWASGSLALGAPPMPDDSNVIRFRCLQTTAS